MKRRPKKIKFLIIIAFLAYVTYTFTIQEIEYQKYQELKSSYTEQIRLAKLKTEEYKKSAEYIKSDEYIEKIAREKLGMVYPEEKIYIQINN